MMGDLFWRLRHAARRVGRTDFSLAFSLSPGRTRRSRRRSRRFGLLETLEWRQLLTAIRELPGFAANALPAGSEVSSERVELAFELNLFGTTYDHLFVNSNGSVSFDAPLPEFRSVVSLQDLDVAAIAPFWANVANQTAGSITYGVDQIDGRPAFGATWNDVLPDGVTTDSGNEFQLVLIDRSDREVGGVDIEFNYDQVTWDTSTAAAGEVPRLSVARAGMTAGSGESGTFFELIGSGQPGELLDSDSTTGLVRSSLTSGELGRYRFELRAGTMLDDLGLVGQRVPVADGGFFLGRGIPSDQLQLLAPQNANAADTVNGDALWLGGSLNLGLTGNGTTIGVWDEGVVHASHQELLARVTVVNSDASLSDHATHVAGTIGATGIDPAARGMANGALIRSYDWVNDQAEFSADASQLDVTNHSYALLQGWRLIDSDNDGTVDRFDWLADRSTFVEEDPDFGRYDAGARRWDELLSANPLVLSVWPAGNDRDDRFDANVATLYRTEFTGGFGGRTDAGWYLVPAIGPAVAPPADGNGGTGYDSLPNAQGQTAKNTLVVGAVRDILDDPRPSLTLADLMDFSAWGPTDDGRIKPDLVANGERLRSTVAESDTAYDGDPVLGDSNDFSGTSMAAASVTGTAALIAEYHQSLFGRDPRAATQKAILIHNAQDAHHVGPDYAFGWGLVDAEASAEFLTGVIAPEPTELRRLVEDVYSGSLQSFTVDVIPREPLKVTLVWHDPAGDIQQGLDDRQAVLVNNLDLTVLGPGGIHYPWTLDVTQPDQPATQTRRNDLDNVEQVWIEAPAAGTYTIQVGHRGTLLDDAAQPYTLLVSGAESIWEPDELEPNDTLDEAAVLGSVPAQTIRRLTIHDAEDQDFIEVTAHDTGRLLIRTAFDHELGDLNLRVLDQRGNVLAVSESMTDDEQLVIPVVSQQRYIIHVAGVEGVANGYTLEIENFAAPAIDGIDLPARDSFGAANDTGVSDRDMITSRLDPEILIDVDLIEMTTAGIPVLTAAQAQAGTQAGVAIEVFVNGNSVGFADAVSGTSNTVFRYRFATGELPQTAFSADSGGFLHQVRAAVRVFDRQADETGNAAPATLRGPLSAALRLITDTTQPVVSAPDLLASSDSGISSTDNITSVNPPAFRGTAEAGAIVRVFANDELVGQTVAATDSRPGAVELLGQWEVTVEPLRFGEHVIQVEVEDRAGNLRRSGLLQVVVDPYEPNDILAQATVLGSLPAITLRDMLLHRTAGTGTDNPLTQLTQSSTGVSGLPDISQQGAHIVFQSDGNLTGQNADGSTEIFLIDTAGTLTQLTTSPDRNSFSAVISATGSRIAFISEANLTGENADGNSEIFLYDAQQGLRQITTSTAAANGGVSISADGRRVSFASTGNYTGNNPEANAEVFLYDETAGITQLTSTTTGASIATSISGDGLRIAFQSTADLIGTNADGTAEIFLWEQGTTLRQITNASRGSFTPSLDASGTRIALISTADLTGGNAAGRSEVFLFDEDNGLSQITTTTTASATTFDVDLSGDGSRLVFASTANLTGANSGQNAEVFVYDDGQGITQLTSGGACGGVAADDDGSRIAFFCEADLLGTNPDELAEVFVWEVVEAPPTASDVDLFKYTAAHTGSLIINLFSQSSLELRLRDARGNLLASDVVTQLVGQRNRGQLIVPSVTQEDYYVEVTRINASASLNDAGLYDLELENYPAPMPNLIELPARDQNTELNDTGTVVLDDVTRRSNPEILVHADLTDFIAQGIPLLNPAAATAGNQPGAAVELFVDGQSVGFAAVVPDTANTLFRFELTSAALQAAGFPADSLGELYFVSAATRVFDLQENAAGVAAPATGRTLLAEPLRLHVDSTPPAGSVPDLIDSSDSGWHQDDNVTAIATPTFQGTAEHNAIVRLFVQNVTDPQNPGPWEFVGQTVAGSDLTDGTSGTPNGSTIDHAGIWQITASPLDDLADESTAFFASYQVRTEIEDLAGNVATTDSLQIWVDRREPALPSLDLVAEHDSGRHNDDDVTNVNQPTLAITLNDTPQGGTNPFPNQLFYRLYDRFTPPGEMVTDGEQLLHQGPLDSQGFTRLSLQTLGITLADGAHELRLQAEDLAGNVSHSYVLQLVIDTQAPPATVQLDPDSDTGVWGYPATMQDRITSDKSPRLVGTAEANTVVRAVINGTPAGTSVAVPIDGNHAFPPPPGYVGNYQLDTILSLADGLQQVELYVEDLAGNGRDQVAATLDFFVDTQGPRITNITWGDVSRRGTFTFDENTTSVFRPKPAGGPDPLISSIVVHLHDLPERTEQFNPAALWEALVAEEGHFRLVGDANGEIPILATILRRIENAADGGARATIELVFHDPGADRQLFTADDRGAPLPDDRLTLTISDTLTDPAGNSLDGESGAAAPFAGANVPDPTPPVFPTGDGQHGGTFDARFTVDSRAELGVWSAGSVYLDLNGNFQFDPASGDAVNRDVAHTFGLTSDYIFAGNFPDNGVADGYDKLAAYGNVDGRFRWLVDVNNDANPDIRQFDAANLVGMPIAGRFNRELSGDQVGLFTSTHWYVDANGDVMLAGERARASGMTGLPVAGDFDRDGIQDLATWDVRENRFQISLSTAGGGLANPQRFRQFTLDAGFPFIGVRERPVAADFDGDGYDDLGLWVPDRSGAAPDEMAEWFLLLSHGAPVTSRIRNDAIKFTPVPFGPDIYAQYGDQFGVPVVGNFDPPSVLVVGASEGADDGAGAGAGTGAGTSASAGAGTSPSTSTGTGTGTSTGTSTSTGAGAGTSTGTGTSPSTGAGAGTGTSASTGAGTGTEGNSTFDARDVNRDGSITPRDALLVLNEVNRAWSAAADESVVIELRLDVNADGFVTPRDALLILNHINSESAAPQQASIAVESRSAELSAFEFAAAADQIFADNVLRVSRR